MLFHRPPPEQREAGIVVVIVPVDIGIDHGNSDSSRESGGGGRELLEHFDVWFLFCQLIKTMRQLHGNLAPITDEPQRPESHSGMRTLQQLEGYRFREALQSIE